MERQTMERLCAQYGLQLKFYEAYGRRVYKIYSNKGEFALKRISAQQGIDFFKHIQYLYQRGYHRIVPIFPTLDGRYAIMQADHLFYLMPWLENRGRVNPVENQKELFRELARLHTISAREVDVSEEDRREHYEQTVSSWEKEQELLEDLVEQAEREWYMSPFHLMFCTHYREIAQAQHYALKKFNEWYEMTKDRKKARSVIIHGKVSPDHFLYNDSGLGFFTNFEEASAASPIHDLLPFLAKTFKTYPRRFDESVELLSSYFRYFPFKDEEILLFLSYLSRPSTIFSIVEEYFSSGRGKNELKLVRQFQRQYWYMKNTEYVVMRLEEIEQRKQEANQPKED